MARRRKTTTKAIIEAEQRIAGMKSINKNLDLENGVSVAEGEAILAAERTLLGEYSELLAQADAKLNEVNSKDKELRAFNKKILPAVGLKYGTDSSEYEMVGGVRESERKKPGKRTTIPTL